LGGKGGRCVGLKILPPLVTCILNSHPKTVTIPDAVLIQFVLLKMTTTVVETSRGM